MKVGDYVRTPQGIIAKIINIQEDTSQYFLNGNAVSLESKNYIADKNITVGENFKHSPNIMDLIEVGDYVNGCYVTNIQASHNEGITIIPKRIGIIKCNAYFNQGNYNDCDFKWIEEKDIKSIVTKEQFLQLQEDDA